MISTVTQVSGTVGYRCVLGKWQEKLPGLNGFGRQRTRCDLTVERIGDLRLQSGGLREVLRINLVVLQVSREMDAAKTCIAGLKGYVPLELVLNREIPLPRIA